MDRSPRRRRLRSVILGAMLAAGAIGSAVPGIPVLEGRALAGSTNSIWGWVTARNPTADTYAPGPKDHADSAGGSVTVARYGVGHYSVTFDDLDSSVGSCAHVGGWGCNGSVQVTALSTRRRICWPADWGPGTSTGVEVYCSNRAGALRDSAFSVAYLSPRDQFGDLAYLQADQPASAFYTPATQYNYNSVAAGQSNTVRRAGTGTYAVSLTSLIPASGGNVQLATGDGATCRMSSWAESQTEVLVICRDLAGARVDHWYLLLYTDDVGLTGVPGLSAAYVWANRPTADSYRPEAAHRYSSAGTVPTVRRTGVGSYVVKLPGMPLGGGAQVTAFTTGRADCQLASIRRTGTPQRIGVTCYKPNGDLVDSAFLLSFAR